MELTQVDLYGRLLFTPTSTVIASEARQSDTGREYSCLNSEQDCHVATLLAMTTSGSVSVSTPASVLETQADNFVLETRMLNKYFGNVKAVRDLTVRLESNKIYGLLGRNGAGKTTFLNLISSKIFADSGEIRLFGQIAEENQEMLSRVCYMPEKNLFIPAMRRTECC